MTAKEQILQGITVKAEHKKEEILSEAKIKAQENFNNAIAKANEEAQKIIAAAQKKADTIIENANSSAMLIKRNESLKFKTKSINEVLNNVKLQLNSLDDKEYFALLLSLAEKNTLDGEGIIYLNKKDLTRETSDFKKQISKLNLTLSDSPRDMEGGFMLQYGDIIINCAFEALINEKREKLTDDINKMLFA